MNIPNNTHIARDGNDVADLACKFCIKLPLRHYVEGREVGLSLSDHHKIFHSDCQNCFGNNNSKLCEPCSHIRFEHYMGCCRQDNTVSKSMKLRLKSFGSFDLDCLACSFWRDLLEKRPGKFVRLHGDVKITLRPVDRDGGQKSLPRWPLILGPNLVAEEWTPWLLIAQGDKRSENIQFGARIRQSGRDKVLPLNPMIDWTSVSQFPLGIQTTGEEALKSIPQIQKFWKESWLANYGSVPDNLGVIDVFQDCVVPIPRSCPYVTLSYVWGKDHGQLQATMANKAILAQPNSLSTVVLPQTISDAMEVCRKLKQRYLWVDRLCIPQDDPDIKVLLDCMGAIYQNASFGIVAVDGDAETGLPGVGKTPRKWAQSSLTLGRLELLACAPNLRFYIPETAWARRGWTFQEQTMSNRQLYFTHYGLYYDAASIPGEFSESPAEMSGMRRRTYDLREDYWDALEKYSLRVLTYPEDFLRAFSGLLFSIVGAETLWGLPQAHFDEALLWHDDPRPRFVVRKHSQATFPSWSWTAASGRISSRAWEDSSSMGPIAAVALWVFVPAGTDRPTVLRPTRQPDHFSHSKRPSAAAQDAERRASRLSAALVCFEGCIKGKDNFSFLRGRSRDALDVALQQRWPRYIDFWDEMFDSLSPRDPSIFPLHLIQSASTDGRILVHTQHSFFRLDPLRSVDTRVLYEGVPVVIRGVNDSTPAGIMYLQEAWLQGAFAESCTYEFLALSAETESLLNYNPYVFCFGSNTSMMSRFVGCGCSDSSRPNGDPQHRHVALCPSHSEFPGTSEGESAWNIVAEKLSANLAYRDIDGVNIVEDEHRINTGRVGVFLGSPIATLNVMLVERMGGDKSVCKRIGLGKIYLKKWLEGKPTFKTQVIA